MRKPRENNLNPDAPKSKLAQIQIISQQSHNIFLVSNPRQFSLNHKWVLITGASSGFGAAAATAFAREGARLLLGARRIDRLKEVAELAKKAGAVGSAFSHA